MTWIRIHFFQCGSRIRIRIKIEWSTDLSIIFLKKLSLLKTLQNQRFFKTKNALNANSIRPAPRFK